MAQRYTGLRLCDALEMTPTQPDVVAFVGAGGKSSAMFRLADELVSRGERVVLTTTTRMAAAQIDAVAHVLAPDGELPLSALVAALDAHGHCLIASRTPRSAAGEAPKQAGLAPMLVDQLAARARELEISAILVEADGSRMLPAKAPAGHEPVLPDSTTILMPVLGVDALGRRLTVEQVHRPESVRDLLALSADDETVRLTPAHGARLLTDPRGGAKGRPSLARLVPLINKVDTPTRLALAQLVARSCAAAGYLCLIGAVGVASTPAVRRRWAPWTAAILAAGASRRLGSPKQLLMMAGKPLVVHAAARALESDAAQVLIVTGAHHDAVEAALAPLLTAEPTRLHLVYNAAWAQGQSTSVRAVVDAAAAASRALLLAPVDQPFLPAALFARLVAQWRSGAPLAAPTVDGRLRGAPCLFDRRFWPELCALTGDVGGRSVLSAHAEEAATVEIAAELLVDIDTPDHLTFVMEQGKS